MNLRQKMIQKIDDFGGIDKLSSELERIRILATEKKWFDNMIFYFNSLYTKAIDVESMAIEFKQTSLDTIKYLEKFNKSLNEPAITFIIDLINYKLTTVSGIRKIS